MNVQAAAATPSKPKVQYFWSNLAIALYFLHPCLWVTEINRIHRLQTSPVLLEILLWRTIKKEKVLKLRLLTYLKLKVRNPLITSLYAVL